MDHSEAVNKIYTWSPIYNPAASCKEEPVYFAVQPPSVGKDLLLLVLLCVIAGSVEVPWDHSLSDKAVS